MRKYQNEAVVKSYHCGHGPVDVSYYDGQGELIRIQRLGAYSKEDPKELLKQARQDAERFSAPFNKEVVSDVEMYCPSCELTLTEFVMDQC